VKDLHDLGIMNGMAYMDRSFQKVNIYIDDDIIRCISSDVKPCRKTYDAKGKKIIPGLIDPHVHFELDTGNIVSCDDFYSGSVSAAFGGVTTFIDFLDPVSKSGDLESALEKRKKLAEKSIVDYKFHATLANPAGQTRELAEIAKSKGLDSIKIFTTYSESGRRTYEKEIRELLSLSKELGFILLVHAENDNMVGVLPGHKVWDITAARNEEAEISEALSLAGMVEETGGNLYMVHVSSGHTIQALSIRYPHLLGKRFHIESCPHYFFLNLHEYDHEDGYLFTMVPPLRSHRSQGLLLNNVDLVETIGTDHCAYMKKDKEKENLKDIPMGVGSIEYSFLTMYGLLGNGAIDRMSENPAKIFGLYPRKGVIREQSDADLVILDDDGPYLNTEDHSASDYSIYTQGVGAFASMIKVVSVISRGRFVIEDEELKGGNGKCLL
jgi:dihydropyrimidinase